MSDEREDAEMPCATACRQCRAGRDCPADGGGLSGWRLTVSAAGTFLLPLALAALGAKLCGPDQVGQLVGALVGLVVGVGGSLVLATFVRRTVKENG